MFYIVTGGVGFIGSHVTEYLLSEGHSVTVVDNLATGDITNISKHPQLRLVSKNILDCTVEDFPIPFDGLAHLAATPSVVLSWQNPLVANENNISATVAVLQLCQQLKIPRLVFASSAAVYGNLKDVPTTEESPTIPISPYGLHKLVGEKYIDLFVKEFGNSLGWSAVSLRLFNVFGPRQDPHSPYSGVISLFAKAMTQGTAISINGDGTQNRDFIYVKDVAHAFAQALIAPLDPGTHLVCNIGTGNSTSLIQLKKTLQKVFPEWEGETLFKSPRPGDIKDSLADIRQAHSHLGFIPRISLEDGLTDLRKSLM